MLDLQSFSYADLYVMYQELLAEPDGLEKELRLVKEELEKRDAETGEWLNSLESDDDYLS